MFRDCLGAEEFVLGRSSSGVTMKSGVPRTLRRCPLGLRTASTRDSGWAREAKRAGTGGCSS